MTRKKAGKPANPAPPKPRRWPRRLAITAVVLVVLYTLFGFFGVPLLIRKVAIPQLNKRLNATASLVRAQSNPYTFSLQLEGFELVDPSSTRVLAFDKFSTNLELFATIFRDGWHLDHILVSKAFVDATLSKDGRLSLLDLVKPDPNPAPSSGPWLTHIPRIIIRDVTIEDAGAHFTDLTNTTPFEKRVEGVDLNLTQIDTRPDNDNPLRFTAGTRDGETVAWSGMIRADPLSSKGTFSAVSIDLAKLMPYVEPRTEASIQSGKVSLSGSYELALFRADRVARLNLESLHIDGFNSTQPDGPLATAHQVDLANVAIDAVNRRIEVEAVTVDKGALAIRRANDGILSLTRLLVQADAAVVEARSTTDAPAPKRDDPLTATSPLAQIRIGLTNLVLDALGPWSLTLQRLATQESELSIEDRATPTPAAFAFTSAALTAGPIASEDRFRIPVKVDASAWGGQVSATGELLPIDVRATLAVDLKDVPLDPFAPYIPANIGEGIPSIALAGGVLSVKGDLVAARDEQDELSISWKGAAEISALRIDQRDPAAPMLSIGALAADGSLDLLLPVGAAASGTWEGEARMQTLAFEGDVKGPTKASVESLEVKCAATLPRGSSGATFLGEARLSAAAMHAPAIIDGDVNVAAINILGIDLAAGEQRATVESLEINAPFIKANLTLLAPPSSPAAEGQAAEPPIKRLLAIDPATLPQVHIESLAVRSGTLDVTDPTAAPPTNIRMTSLDFAAKEVTTDGVTPADINFSCVMQDLGNVSGTGKLNPVAVARSADLSLKVQTLPLKPYDAFAGRYAGYYIESGRATVDLPLTIREGKVNGTLTFNLENIHLGESVKSPDAPDIPLKLGLDLLRDSEDRVAGEIPLKGDLTDPEFSFSGLVWKAVLNLIGGIVTAPFKLLGELVGLAEGQDLSRVEFEAGSAALSPDEMSVIDAMAQALEKRRSLSLVIVGRHAESDKPIVRVQMLREQIAQARKDAKPDPADPAYRDALEDAYRDANGREAIVQARKDHPEAAKLLAFYEQTMSAPIEPDPARLLALAAARADQVLRALIDSAGAPADRVTIGEPKDPAEPADNPMAEFALGK